MATRTGTNGNDVLNGTSRADIITALAGNDICNGLGGNDQIFGGDGDDVLRGGSGNDRLRGDRGNDQLFGDSGVDWALYDTDPDFDGDQFGVFVQLSSGRAVDGWGDEDTLTSIENVIGSQFNDIIEGDIFNNRLEGRAGDDVMAGGAGNDTLLGGTGNDILDGEEGADKLYGGSGNDELFGGDGNDRLFGDSGNDFLSGGDGNDILQGGSGDDQLEGGDGNDDLDGGDGDDILNGGAGDDILRGGGPTGTGRDTFVYDARGDANDQGDDIIVDFRKGFDTVLLDFDGFTSFDQLDTNGDNVLNSLDFAITVRNVTFGGVTARSTVIDVSKLEGAAETLETLTFYDRTNIAESDFTIINPSDLTLVDGDIVDTAPDLDPPPIDFQATSI